jgi:alpha 1,2-mannosyltransferase
MEENPGLVSQDNAMGFISDDGGRSYNRCHCEHRLFLLCLCCVMQVLVSWHITSTVWSNFEIGDLDFWRGEAYTKFVDFLDKKGGFYYEVRHSRSFAEFHSDSYFSFRLHQRWGDAPVHSIGVALFARKDQIHFFNDIGYMHVPFKV